MALPGGNPLQVALEAGETPSPEMVAAAPKKGALRPAVAVGLLAAFLGAFVLMSGFNQKIKSYNLAPLEKPPEVLAEKSRQILQKAGYQNAPADSVYRFEATDDFLNYAFENDWEIAKIRESLRLGQPFEIYFLYRQSPRYLEPKESENVTENEPPLNVAGMSNVKLDTRGRLVELVAVPPQVAEPTAKAAADWNALFTEAGLDIAKFRETEPQWTPPVFADERRAWEGFLTDLPEIPARVESAAFQGKPVFFRVAAPWLRIVLAPIDQHRYQPRFACRVELLHHIGQEQHILRRAVDRRIHRGPDPGRLHRRRSCHAGEREPHQ